MSCPECGSETAVSKAEAWDAACSTPPKVKKELERLRLIENAARDVLKSPPGVATMPVPRDALNALRAAFGLVAL